MSSSVLPAALRRRRMGLADGLDIGSLLSYGLLITRRELRSSVGRLDVLKATGIANFQTPASQQPIMCQNPSELDRTQACFSMQACCCLFSPAFHTNPPLIINGAIVCVGGLFPTPPCLAKTHISQSQFRQLEESKK